MIDRLQYDNWPRWMKVAYWCMFPLCCPVLMLSMMLGTIALGLVLMIYCLVLLPFSLFPSPQENTDV